MSKTAIILAAGKAERLMPLSHRRPKCMFLLAGRPIIEHVLDAVKALDVTQVIMVVDHEDTMVRAFVGDGANFGVDVEYVLQSGHGGSATALRLVELGQVPEEGAFVFPAHLFLEKETALPLQDASGDTMLAAIATADHKQGSPVVKGDRLVSMAAETPTVGSTRVTAGIYRFSKEYLQFLQGCDQPTIGATLEAYAKDHPVHVRDVAGAWEPLVDPDDIIRINELALRDVGEQIGDDVVIHESATLVPPVSIGDGCHIGENAVVGPYVSMRSNCRVGALCEVRDSILNNNVVLDTRSVLRAGIMDDGASTGPGFLAPKGCIVGTDAIIGSGVVFDVRHVVQPEESVPSGTVIGAS